MIAEDEYGEPLQPDIALKKVKQYLKTTKEQPWHWALKNINAVESACSIPVNMIKKVHTERFI